MKKAETNVQFFSHLNGLTLDNKWGEMIRLLDACLVYGLKLPDISTIEIQEEGKILIEFKSQHKCLLFQCVTLSDFTPSLFNDKYRIIGVPTQTQILISSDIERQSIDKIGTASLSSLDYEIIFGSNTKRVYRAKNPTSQHPFIRVDESTASEDDSGIYNENYAKYAMVGLHENMTHIDDYLDASKLQLPLNTSDLSANYKITGTGSGCVRGWSKWYWARYSNAYSGSTDTSTPSNGIRQFSLIGDKNAFYLLRNMTADTSDSKKILAGCGLYNSSLQSKAWFLMSYANQQNVLTSIDMSRAKSGAPLFGSNYGTFLKNAEITFGISDSVDAIAITPDDKSGATNLFGATNISALEIPFYDSKRYLCGSLQHIYYAGNQPTQNTESTPLLSDSSMYLWDCAMADNHQGGFYFYLGEL